MEEPRRRKPAGRKTAEARWEVTTALAPPPKAAAPKPVNLKPERLQTPPVARHAEVPVMSREHGPKPFPHGGCGLVQAPAELQLELTELALHSIRASLPKYDKVAVGRPARTEPIREVREVYLIDAVQHLYGGPLDDLVFQNEHRERPLFGDFT